VRGGVILKDDSAYPFGNYKLDIKRISGFWHPRNAYSLISLSPDMLLTAYVAWERNSVPAPSKRP